MYQRYFDNDKKKLEWPRLFGDEQRVLHALERVGPACNYDCEEYEDIETETEEEIFDFLTTLNGLRQKGLIEFGNNGSGPLRISFNFTDM